MHHEELTDGESIAIVGAGRLGGALARTLSAAGARVIGPLGRGATAAGAEVVLLAVPDAEIGSAARAVEAGPLVGHCSGATTLEPLAPHERFSLHPLTSVADASVSLAGAACAINGSTPRAQAMARYLAERLGMRPFVVEDDARDAYHAAASLASNYLVALEDAAAALAAHAGVDRSQLLPLVRATVESWGRLGGADALTGPIARGDDATVTRQRAAVARLVPDHLALWDALTGATRRLALRRTAAR